MLTWRKLRMLALVLQILAALAAIAYYIFTVGHALGYW